MHWNVKTIGNTISYMFRHFLSIIIRKSFPDDDTQEMPKHVGDGVGLSVVFKFQCM